ncbi:MAG: anti-sigma factor ChrR (cupin superfamily) [Planctomycetota bacterium]
MAVQIPGLRLDGASGGLGNLPWRPTRYPGVEWLDLVPEAEPEEKGSPKAATQTVLIRMAPGSGYPTHRHLGPEDVLVLAGGYRDDDGRTFRAGEFVRYPAGSEHSPVALEGDSPVSEACVLFAVAHGGTVVVTPDS